MPEAFADSTSVYMTAATSDPRTDFDPKWLRLLITGPRRPRSVALLPNQTSGSFTKTVSFSQFFGLSVSRIARPRLVVGRHPLCVHPGAHLLHDRGCAPPSRL